MTKIEEIKSRLAEALHKDEIDTSANFKELGLDSLDIVELLLQLEEEYGIHFDDVDMSQLKYIISGGDFLSVQAETRINNFLHKHHLEFSSLNA